jgi:hypothetical protein
MSDSPRAKRRSSESETRCGSATFGRHHIGRSWITGQCHQGESLRVARKGDNEFALSLIGHEAREAMTRRVFSERYGKPIDQIRASQVFAGILQRLAQ